MIENTGEYSSWGLPEGAKARIGKGTLSSNIAYSPDGTQLAVASSIGIWLYDAQTCQELSLLTGHTDWVGSIAFRPDGKILASGSSDNTIRLWDIHAGKQQQTLEGHTDDVRSVTFSSDGSILASGSWDSTIRLWDAHTGQHKATLEEHTREVNLMVSSTAYSPVDNRTLASVDTGGIWLWDVDTRQRRTIWQPAFLEERLIESIVFSPDGKTLASGDEGGYIQLWNMDTGEHKQTLKKETGTVYSVVYSPGWQNTCQWR